MMSKFPLIILLLLSSPAWAGDLPDAKKTPGVARTDLSVKMICSTKWGKDHRAVTEKMKAEVFASYGIDCRQQDCGKNFEVDHLISREISGADDVKNLWPQPYAGKWGAKKKDRLENRLHVELCAGNITLKEAQSALVNDWTKTYIKYFGESE